MSAEDNLSKRQFPEHLFHGTEADVKEGDLLHPLSDESPIYSSTHQGEASSYGSHLYQVKPTFPADLHKTESFTHKDGSEAHNYATAYPYEVIKKLK
jgi:hypothetical protein